MPGLCTDIQIMFGWVKDIVKNWRVKFLPTRLIPRIEVTYEADIYLKWGIKSADDNSECVQINYKNILAK